MRRLHFFKRNPGSLCGKINPRILRFKPIIRITLILKKPPWHDRKARLIAFPIRFCRHNSDGEKLTPFRVFCDKKIPDSFRYNGVIVRRKNIGKQVQPFVTYRKIAKMVRDVLVCKADIIIDPAFQF